MAQLNREQVAKKLGDYYSKKLNGNVCSYFDEQKRAYVIQGERLPAKFAFDGSPAKPGDTWSMLDYVKPAEARRLIAH